MHFCNSEISSPLLFPQLLGLKSFVCTAVIKVAEKFHFSLAEQKMKLCYLAGAIMHFKKFNKFIYFEFLPMKKGSHKCWKIHVFKLKSYRLVSRKLQKTRTSVMISSRMFGIFVINEAIENTCNLLKNDVFNQWSWALLKWRLQTMMMTFMEWWPRMTHEWWVQSVLMSDEWWV